MIPLVHDFSGATVLVFGGGPVGARKARRFAAEARVIVISPEFAVGVEFGDVERVRAAPTPAAVPGWLRRVDPALAIAATDDPAVNAAVEDAALEAGVLVNRADVGGGRAPGSVVVPATARAGPLQVAVSSQGTDPLTSQAVRDRLEPTLDRAAAVAEAVETVRSSLADAGVDRSERGAAVRAVLGSDAVWTAAESGDPTAVAHHLAFEGVAPAQAPRSDGIHQPGVPTPGE